jgi:hypothetical protein
MTHHSSMHVLCLILKHSNRQKVCPSLFAMGVKDDRFGDLATMPNEEVHTIFDGFAKKIIEIFVRKT